MKHHITNELFVCLYLRRDVVSPQPTITSTFLPPPPPLVHVTMMMMMMMVAVQLDLQPLAAA